MRAKPKVVRKLVKRHNVMKRIKLVKRKDAVGRD